MVNGIGWINVVKSPLIERFTPSEGVMGRTVVEVYGEMLHHVDQLDLVSNLDGDVVPFTVWGTGYEEDNRTVFLTGLTPS